MKKILFCDVDGVINCQYTTQRHGGYIGIDPLMALFVDRIVEATGCTIVLSSTWRLDEGSRSEVKKFVDFKDVTPDIAHEVRWKEVQAWLAANPEETRFAVIDDNWYDFPANAAFFFKTSWLTGLTQEIADKVIAHLNA